MHISQLVYERGSFTTASAHYFTYYWSWRIEVKMARSQGKWCNVVDATAVVSAKIARALKLKGPAPTVSQAKTKNVATDLA